MAYSLEKSRSDEKLHKAAPTRFVAPSPLLLRKIVDFDRQLEQMPHHQRAGFLDSFYAQLQREPIADANTLEAAIKVLKKWDHKNNFRPHRLKVFQQQSEAFGIQQMIGISGFMGKEGLPPLHTFQLRSGVDMIVNTRSQLAQVIPEVFHL